MALVTLSGYPASGKTTRAFQLCKLLEASQSLSVVVWNDENLGLPASAYDSELLIRQSSGNANAMSSCSDGKDSTSDSHVCCDQESWKRQDCHHGWDELCQRLSLSAILCCSGGRRPNVNCMYQSNTLESADEEKQIHIAAPKDKCTEWNKAREKQYADAT